MEALARVFPTIAAPADSPPETETPQGQDVTAEADGAPQGQDVPAEADRTELDGERRVGLAIK